MEQHNQQSRRRRQQKIIRSIMNFLQGVTSTLFVFAVIFIIYLIAVYCTRLKPITNYAIVFDAGSSHTEMFVYQWPADKSNGLGTTSAVSEYFVCPLKGINIQSSKHADEFIKLKAISDFEHHLDALEEYFRACLTEAILKIPSNRHRFSPIFLGATAGMRLLRMSNATKSDEIMETIREVFSRTPFQFVVARQVRILTGMEEAADGWITTNILLEKFNQRHARKKSSKHAKAGPPFDSDMVGVLDLGGASTQVTYTHQNNINDEPIPKEFTTNITLFDAVYSPYAHSYLCWGKNEALKRYRARLFNAALSRKHASQLKSRHILVRDPCFPRGTNDTTTITSLFHSPCTANEKDRFNNLINPLSIKFMGAGNASQCRQTLISLFDAKRNDRTVNCSYKPEYCTFDHAFQPDIPTNIQFIGLSGYYYVFNNLAYGMMKNKGAKMERYRFQDFQEQEIFQRLFNVCETSYPILYKQESITPSNEPHKRALCFDAWYMWLLLTHAIGFKQTDLQRLTFASTFPTGKVGWTLGYMINQTNYIPAEYRQKKISRSTFIGWMTTLLIIGVIAFVFLFVTCYVCFKKKSVAIRNNRDGYSEAQEQTSV